MLDAGLGAETRGPHDTELQVAGDMGEASAWTIMQTRRYQAGLPAGASALLLPCGPSLWSTPRPAAVNAPLPCKHHAGLPGAV